MTKTFRLAMVCGLRLVIENWNVVEEPAGRVEVDPGETSYARTGQATEAAR